MQAIYEIVKQLAKNHAIFWFFNLSFLFNQWIFPIAKRITSTITIGLLLIQINPESLKETGKNCYMFMLNNNIVSGGNVCLREHFGWKTLKTTKKEKRYSQADFTLLKKQSSSSSFFFESFEPNDRVENSIFVILKIEFE